MLASRQNLLDYAKQSATDILKTAPKREIQKRGEVVIKLLKNYKRLQKFTRK